MVGLGIACHGSAAQASLALARHVLTSVRCLVGAAADTEMDGGGGYAGGSWVSQAWDGWGGGGGGAGWGGGGYGGPDGPDPGKGDGKGTGRQRRKRGVVDSDSEPEVNTKDGASLGLPAVPRMDDDDTRLATGYKSSGTEWKW